MLTKALAALAVAVMAGPVDKAHMLLRELTALAAAVVVARMVILLIIKEVRAAMGLSIYAIQTRTQQLILLGLLLLFWLTPAVLKLKLLRRVVGLTQLRFQ